MRNVVRGLVLMIQISLRADTPRTIGTARNERNGSSPVSGR